MTLPPGLGVGAAAAALRDNPRVDYAAPNYIATASGAVPDPQRPRHRSGHARASRGLGAQAVELPALRASAIHDRRGR